ncbi:MAG: hypothetical protein JNM62_02615 [Flavobacteriales bacterium]|nr:hypothetical protein [Flavobacteriales bacterium]
MRAFTTVFLLCITIAATAQPPNDQCSAVTPFDLSIGSSVTRTGTRTGATTTNDGVAGSALMTTPNATTVWEAFTTTECSNVSVLFCGTPLPATNMWNFITATCPADVPIYFSYANFGILCPNGQFGIQWFNLPAGTYYLPIQCTPSGGQYTVEFSAATCIPGPANDDCANAISLTVNTVCEPVDGSVEHATFSFPASECNGATGNPNDDVWFSFVATGSEHTIQVNGLPGDLDAVIELFGSDCSVTTPIACADAGLAEDSETIEAEGLEVGSTYRFRVFHYYTSLAIAPEFTVCVTGDTGTGLHGTERSSIAVRPTLTDGLVTVSGAAMGSSFRVIERTGRVVEQGRISIDQQQLDLSGHPIGVYSIEIITPDGVRDRISVVRN